ncbi:hypothetical protein PLESTB_001584700 [Pleodorina starrii]|uniref:ubiquitinyl hydrolase 1 n=1 Tax=Pleodorina starrii TaxID=330485 RepID=A0A9W6BXR9_9CHLO|nr:hypothetical protein PLESTM_000585700 [Pleodorina starrii]GLC60199.1 hypothetical protein PLESTB_001584700 [Pleodorina starrii]GLC65960.1 hypothetical protein PLESTF_000366800 [Pleodorina starrii]
MCLKHTLNNLFQREAFTAADLNNIANSLTPPNLIGLSPHRNFLGNYDANVLEAAFQRHNKALTWLPLRRTPPTDMRQEQQPSQPEGQAQQPPLAAAELPTGSAPVRPLRGEVGQNHATTGQDDKGQEDKGQEDKGQEDKGEDDKGEGEGQSEVQQVQRRDQLSQREPASGSGRGAAEPGDGLGGGGGGGGGPAAGASTGGGVWDVAGVLSRPDLWALVVNVTHGSAFPPWRWLVAQLGGGGRHWLGLRRFGGTWYNLDSHLSRPEPFDSEEAVCAFLQRAVERQGATVLLVTST